MNQKFFPGVHLIRVWAAIGVLVQHAAYFAAVEKDISYLTLWPIPTGVWGVFAFFAVSGFVICLARHVAPPAFFARRFLRIYPGYWAAALLSFPIVGYIGIGSQFTWKTILLVPYGEFWGILLPAWTLLFEVVFYAMAGAVFALRLSDERLSQIILAWMACICLANPYLGLTPHAPGLFMPLASYNLLFGAGMLTALHLDRLTRMPNAVFLGAAIVAAIMLQPNSVTLPNIAIYSVLFSAALTVAAKQTRMSRPIEILGNASYGLYLLHYPVIVASAKLLAPHIASPFALAVLLLAIGGCVGGAFGVLEFWAYRRVVGFLPRRCPAPPPIASPAVAERVAAAPPV